MTGPPTPAVAVLVRTRAFSDKVLDLLAGLRRGMGFDVFVCAEETNGFSAAAHDWPDGVGLLRYGEASLGPLGLVELLPDASPLWFFGDYPLYASAAEIPAYDHYVLLDEKIDFVRGNPLFLEGLFRRLPGDDGIVHDLVAAGLGERPPEWVWHAAAAARFPAVHGILSPFLVLSRRALEHLFAWRQAEAALGAGFVFWEALVASALVAAGGFRCTDLNDLIPRAWDPASFPAPEPMLLGQLPPLPKGVELVFPVASEREYLAWLMQRSRAGGTLHDLVARLAPGGDLTVSLQVREWFLREAMLALPTDS